jgi:F-type H+-transporting ATPase subunit delta
MKLDKRLQKIVDQMVKDTADGGKINQEKALKYVKTLKLLSKAEAIAALSQFLKRLKREQQKTTLEIESVEVLSPAQVKQVTGNLQKDFLISEVKTTINTSLLGGLRIKIGDVVFDDSVDSKYQQLKGAILN